MSQHLKLFEKSEIEYITPFLKLWMSFNNWYKQDLTDVRTDRNAINEYKNQGLIKDEFLRLFSLNSDIGISFQNALFDLVLSLLNYSLQDQRGNNISFRVQNEENEEIDLILQNADNRGGREPIYISQKRERFQILNEHKELFFGQTLEIIYQVRCNLVHGNFDIENKYFIKLIESSYKILYPIMERIYQNIEE